MIFDIFLTLSIREMCREACKNICFRHTYRLLECCVKKRTKLVPTIKSIHIVWFISNVLVHSLVVICKHNQDINNEINT